MSSPLVIFREDGARWSFDGCSRIAYQPRARITDHPIEDGTTTSDHRQELPRTLTISATVTATPRSGATFGQPTGNARIWAARDFLDKCVGFCTIVTPDETYSGYMLAGWGHERTASRRLRFSIEFRAVRVATAQSVTIPASQPVESEAAGLPDEVDAGEQATEDTAASDPAGEESDTSALYEIIYGEEPADEEEAA